MKHVQKAHLDGEDEENDITDMEAKVKQKVIQLAMEKGIGAAIQKYKIPKRTLENLKQTLGMTKLDKLYEPDATTHPKHAT